MSALVLAENWAVHWVQFSRFLRCKIAPLWVACACLVPVGPSRGEDMGFCRAGMAAEATLRACGDLIARGQLKPAALSNAYYVRASVWRGRNDAERQLADLNESVRLDRSNAQALVARGVLMRERKSYDLAQRDLDAAIAVDPRNAPAFFERANLKREQGDRDGAVDDYSQSLKIDPNQVPALNNRGYVRRDRKELALALDDFQEALRISPNSPNGHLGRGMILADRGDLTGAIAEFTTLIGINPRWTPIFSVLSRGANPAIMRVRSLILMQQLQSIRRAPSRSFSEPF